MDRNSHEMTSRKAGGGLGESFLVAILSAAGFMVWGLWVNWEHGMGSRIQVALTQAGISLGATLGAAELLRKVASLLAGAKWRRLLTGLIGWVLINAVVFFAHWIFGTPEILKTMIPGMIGGVGFCWLYGLRVTRKAAGQR